MAVPNAAHRAALKVMIAFWPRTALGIGVLQDDGETLFVPLKRIRTQRQKDEAALRFYNQYEMPKEYATREITVRLHNSAEEEARRLNRAENLRAIPPGDPDFGRLYARRADAESLNWNLEDSLYLKKAHSLGHLRQEADLLGFAQLVNSITLARHRARERLRPAAEPLKCDLPRHRVQPSRPRWVESRRRPSISGLVAS